MPVVGPTTSPPPLGMSSTLAPSLMPSPMLSNPAPALAPSNLPQLGSSLMPSPIATKTAEIKSAPKVPLVTLDSETISDTMAARLTSSLLSHVLFLKNQVPFPIAQLARLPSGRNARATKKKEELLDAVDTLSCHLLTTFTALSTALAENKSTYPQNEDGTMPKARADLAVVLGPSVAAARARVLLSVDGLEVKLWGQRDYEQEEAETDSEDEEEGEEESDEGEPDIEEDGSHPSSPAPSESSESDSENSAELLQIPPEPKPRRQPFSPRFSGVTQTEETQILIAAERLLSRTLANACAEDDNGLGSEMAPTQTHVLIRAPRRFSHPSWVPRQNLTSALDTVYNDFLDYSGLIPSNNNIKKPKRAGVKTEGVWVRSQQCSELHPAKDDAEADEMIWWSWDGKIVGFSDW